MSVIRGGVNMYMPKSKVSLSEYSWSRGSTENALYVHVFCSLNDSLISILKFHLVAFFLDIRCLKTSLKQNSLALKIT